MNIFYLDKNPKVAAEMHCNKHVIKMVLEYAQILSTAHRIIDGDKAGDERGLYEIAYKNHPSTVWARLGRGNYNYLSDLWAWLGIEYTHRYGKIHKAATLEWLHYSPDNIPKKTLLTGLTSPPPQCMPDEYKVPGCSITAYWNYYEQDKYKVANKNEQIIVRPHGQRKLYEYSA